MPNWTNTTYVFRSKEKEPIETFRNNLLSWTKEKPIIENAWDGSPYWLGNILLHAGFNYDKEKRSFDCCRCRGTLENIGELEEEDARGEHFFYFYIDTETAWTEMPKMWELIIHKLYPNKIEFGFLAIDECCEYIDRYNPHILKHIGINPENRYWFDKFVDTYRYEEYQWLEECCDEMSSTSLAGLFSELLDRQVTKEEIEDSNKRESLLYDANELLSDIDENFYVKIVEINEVSRDSFE